MKPNTTLTVFIQPPDLGADFSSEGKRANSEKGIARAMAKPSIPMVGAMMLPWVDTATSRNPMMGPVQENETRVRVKAMKKMERSPVVDSDFWSILVAHDEGRVISKEPKNEAAKMISSRANNTLNTAFVERALSAEAPNNRVTRSPKST